MIAGFAHAPVTKGVLITLAVASVCTSLFQLKPFVHLQIHPHLDTHHQYYRPFLQHFAFTNSSELFLALLLFYNAGVKVERTFGTYKYASFFAVVTVIFTAVQFVVLAACSLLFLRVDRAQESGLEREVERSWVVVGRSPAGPWGPLFALLFQYHRVIPHMWSMRIEQLELSDKAIEVYSLAALLAVSQGTSSVFVAVLGMMVSAAYRSKSGPLRRLHKYRLPVRVYRILAFVLAPWVGEIRRPQRSWRVERPDRPTLAVREARLAEHSATVANLNRPGNALGMPRLASLLRRRSAQPHEQPPPPAQAQQQQPPSSAQGWNDLPPELQASLSALPRTRLMAAMQQTDGNLTEALDLIRSDTATHSPRP